MPKETLAPSTYLSVRIKNCDGAARISSELSEAGIRVNNPCLIMPPDIPNNELSKAVADECYAMIDEAESTTLLVFEADDFGNDCATEVGYTMGKGKPVFILSDNPEETWRILKSEDKGVIAFAIGGPQNIFNNTERLAVAIKSPPHHSPESSS